MAQLWLVRHAQASIDADDYDCLSSHGREQARLLGRNLRARGFRPGSTGCGTLTRQRDTLSIALAECPEAPAPDAFEDGDWNEIDAVALLRAHAPQHDGIVALRRALALEAAPERAFLRMFSHALSRWQGGEFDGVYHEPWPVFRARVASAVTSVAARMRATQADALVLTSGGVIATAAAIAQGLPDAAVFPLNLGLANVGITRIAFDGEAQRLVTLNDFGWLEAQDPTAVTYR